ncbi:hypothetical protein FDP41_002106 [Naegleria fowleri]|uniref:Uncharacterized protein n=1 Tax=Naegleria fowleri TaxID=5763 RepID=A0A6A5BUW1_NAEFO|nr:uncharacterized protein FDP41_002106 [Naegleria fowleri]KAF0979036.1 hypothetical protein FDP41_002106 [Naegleria fowleri]CAG4718165.1 unnamed protein product [Naegleria fowleri]
MNSYSSSGSSFANSSANSSSSGHSYSLPGIPSTRVRQFRNEPIISNTRDSFSSCTKKRILKHVADNQDNINNYLVREHKLANGKIDLDPKKRFIFNAEFHVCLHHNKNIRVARAQKCSTEVVGEEGSKYLFSNANDAAQFYQDSMTERRLRKEEKLKDFNIKVKQRIQERKNETILAKQIEVEKLQKEKMRKIELRKKMGEYGKQVNDVNMKNSPQVSEGSHTLTSLSSSSKTTTPRSCTPRSNTPRGMNTPRGNNTPRGMNTPRPDPSKNMDDTEEDQASIDNRSSSSSFPSPHESDTTSSSEELDECSVDEVSHEKTVNDFVNFARYNLANLATSKSQEVYGKYERAISKDENMIIIQAPSFTVYLDEPAQTPQSSLLNKPNYIPLNASSHSEEANEISSIPETAPTNSIVLSNPRTTTTKDQKKKEYREEKRYLKQLNKQFLETIKNMNIQLPMLCNCDIDVLDVCAQHSNNCYYFQNRNDYARDLSSLFHSYKI